jgi:hypothetical protein
MKPCPSKHLPETSISGNGHNQADKMHHCTIPNANYAKVLTVLNRIMQDDRFGICRCERCISDITALSLNYLPPHYHAGPYRGDMGSPWVMVESAVMEAMGMVGNNPRHT